MDAKPHYYSHKLTLSKVKKRSQFFSEDDGSADTPNSQQSIKKVDYQTDDSDSGTPLSLNKLKVSPKAMKSSIFKQ